MSNIFQNILTVKGQQKRTVAETGGASLNITYFKIGDSNGQYYEPSEAQIDLVNTKYTANFTGQSQILINPTSPNEVLYKCFIPAEIGGFTIRELGLFDSNNDLILICKLPAQDKFALDSGLYQPLTFTPKIIFTNPQSQVNLTITSQIIATQNFVTQELSNHKTDILGHKELFDVKANSTALIFTQTQIGNVSTMTTNSKIIANAINEINSNKINKDGSIDLTGLQKYSTNLTPTDDKHLIPKKYADDIKALIKSAITHNAVNSGFALTYSGTTLNYTSGVITDINRNSINASAGSKTLTDLTTGTKYLYFSNGTMEAYSQPFYKQNTTPSSPLTGMVWEDTIIEPLVQKKYNGSTWDVYNGVYIGTATTNGTAITAVSNVPYNQNGYNLNINSFTQSLASNGWTKLPNGLLLQWGICNRSVGGTYNAFPITFPVACKGVYATPKYGPANIWGYGMATEYATVSGFNAYANDQTPSIQAWYFAIGF